MTEVAPAVTVAAATTAAPATTKAFPAIFGANSAIPAPGGTGYAALTFATPRRGIAGSGADGDLALGYVLGSPVTGLSVTGGLNITSLKDFGEDGSVDISVARMLRAGGNSATFVGASAGNLLAWGSAKSDDESVSAYVSHLMTVNATSGEIPMQFTLGYGNNTTRADDGTGTMGEGFFAGFGLGLTDVLSASVSATETQANIGVALAVPQVPGLGISLGVYDVTDNTDRQQTALTVGFSF
ncbi:MAG: hypothetical protein KDE03_06175 [Rhodobacteraceae bacterium]|nr:hypothetical protein [Paracoccaceae bacterium]